MSVYTVREVSGNSKPHPHLESRGLSARSVTISSLDPLAVPDFPQIAYHLYSKLLPAFMVCKCYNKSNLPNPSSWLLRRAKLSQRIDQATTL